MERVVEAQDVEEIVPLQRQALARDQPPRRGEVQPPRPQSRSIILNRP